MDFNPLVRLTLALAGMLAVTLSSRPLQFAFVMIAFILVCPLVRVSWRDVGRSVRLILPWTVLFFAIHLAFSYWNSPDRALGIIFNAELIVLLKLLGLAGVMGVLRTGMEAQSLVDSLKTVLDRVRIRSRMAEDLLQTLRLILVFLPQVLREFHNLERFNLALGFAAPATLREKVRFYGGNLLPVMSRSLARARQLGEVMTLRGYGQVVPRGQLTPVPLNGRDGLAIVAITLLMSSSQWVL